MRIAPKQVVLLIRAHKLRAIRLEYPVDAIHERIFVATAELFVWYVVKQPFYVVRRCYVAGDQVLTTSLPRRLLRIRTIGLNQPLVA